MQAVLALDRVHATTDRRSPCCGPRRYCLMLHGLSCHVITACNSPTPSAAAMAPQAALTLQDWQKATALIEKLARAAAVQDERSTAVDDVGRGVNTFLDSANAPMSDSTWRKLLAKKVRHAGLSRSAATVGADV